MKNAFDIRTEKLYEREEGRAEGRAEASREVAKRMLAKGTPISDICEMTDLTGEDVAQLKLR